MNEQDYRAVIYKIIMDAISVLATQEDMEAWEISDLITEFLMKEKDNKCK